MRLGYRVLIVLYALLFSILSLLVAVAAVGWILPQVYVDFLLNNLNMRWATGIVALILFLLGIWSLLGNLQKPPVSRALVQTTSWGEVHLTLTALENIVNKTAKQIKGVRDVKTRIRCNPEGVAFFMQIALLPGNNIPQVTNELQEVISQEIQGNTGIQVLEVKILVENMTTETKARVE